MHNHNNGDGGMKSMMWMMAICCAAPLIFILIFGAGGGRASGIPSWFIFGGIVIMVATHFLMMRKSHPHSDEEDQMTGEGDKNKDGKGNKNNSKHDCCH